LSVRAGPGGRPVTRVAVGVLVRADGAVLIADRPAGKPYAGHWEFPGGKIEAGESAARALARELHEELGVRIGPSVPWAVLEHDYPHAYVRLYFRRIFDWRGEARALEGQRLRFLAADEAAPEPLLPAAVPALRWARLPTACAYSPGNARDARAAVDWLEAALDRALTQVIWHEPALSDAALADALPACAAMARARGVRLLVDARSARRCAGEAVDCFLSLADLRDAASRPSCNWLGAEVESRADLARAHALDCDFAVTRGAHAGALCREPPLPVYVEQAFDLENLRAARRSGAHGIVLRELPR
jgi:8-oxo-dGTP diphosphatase